MKRRPNILCCHCAYADVVPQDTKRRVLAAIVESGAECIEVADLCELAARKDPSLAEFAASGHAQVIACHERAVRWLFAAAGAPLAPEAVIHDMRRPTADEIIAQLAAAAKHGHAKARGRATQHFAPKKSGEWIPWFPVIDYGRCKNCRQCLQFCLFGVYAADEGGKVRVAKPENCKTGCPACARICPHAAIIFPKYAEGPISGDDAPPPAAEEGRPEKPIDFSSLAGLDIHEAIRRRSTILRAHQEREQAKARMKNPPEEGAPRDE